ncbi:hypothetical protein L1N85_14045 [Paenibacillus alkaliterrae]|uniref:hypothetical protein n=1 Tax=Paenibacillus alkaliterrae TaxID=320909 RepID=UPI001F3DF483|nr:hypothetical protein [Paenibacillus alkaliterrae]MCF2939541.1 hypothetical protein [Paenibacillus alkaliterrae]
MLILRVVWAIAAFINLCAVMWFIIGTTANFQRGIDLVSTVILVYFGIPSLLLIILSIVLIIKAWQPSSIWGVIGVSILILSMLTLSPPLFKNVNTSGWLTEKVTTDTLQVTADGKYEYHLELVNLFQKNSYARLYLRSISTGEELRIPLEMEIYKIKGISLGRTNFWITLEQTLEPNKYSLRTTKDFPLQDGKYDIDINKGIAVKAK